MKGMRGPFSSSYNNISHKKEKKNACSYNVDTKRCTFCTLNLYKHCLFSCSSYFNVEGIIAFSGEMYLDAYVKPLPLFDVNKQL